MRWLGSTRLHRQLIDEMTVHNLSTATHRSYNLRHRKIQSLLRRSPNQLGVGKGSPPTGIHPRRPQAVVRGRVDQVWSALGFFFGVTLGQQDAIADIVRPQGAEEAAGKC